MAGEVKCEKCGSTYVPETPPGGKPGPCPFCRTALAAPAAKQSRPPSGPIRLIVHFPCGKCGVVQRVARVNVGEAHRCAKCGHSQIVPKPPPEPAAGAGAGAGAGGSSAAGVAAALGPATSAAGSSGAAAAGVAAGIKTTKRPTSIHRSVVLTLKCAKCGTDNHTTHSHVGEKIACKSCGTKMLVPVPGLTVPAGAAPGARTANAAAGGGAAQGDPTAAPAPPPGTEPGTAGSGGTGGGGTGGGTPPAI